MGLKLKSAFWAILIIFLLKIINISKIDFNDPIAEVGAFILQFLVSWFILFIILKNYKPHQQKPLTEYNAINKGKRKEIIYQG